MTQRKHAPKYTAEFRERSVRLFKENRADYASDNAAYIGIAPKLGCSPDCLRTAGKPHKLVVTAVARKLVTIANALCKSRQNWASCRVKLQWLEKVTRAQRPYVARHFSFIDLRRRHRRRRWFFVARSRGLCCLVLTCD